MISEGATGVPARAYFNILAIPGDQLELMSMPFWVSFTQERNRGVERRSSRDGDACKFIIVAHLRRLQLPIILIILNDAEGIDPEIF